MKKSNALVLAFGQAAILSLCFVQLHCGSESGDDTSTAGSPSAGAAGHGGGTANAGAGHGGAAGAGISHVVGCSNVPKDEDKCFSPGPACADPDTSTCVYAHPSDITNNELECLYRVAARAGCPCVEFSVRKCTVGSVKGVQRCEKLPGQDDQTQWGSCGSI